MFWEIFYALCAQKGMKPSQVVKICDISAGSVTKWKNGAIPSGATLQTLSSFFGVTVDELLADRSSLKKEEAPADTPEAKFMETVRGLSVEEFRELENYLNYILSKRRKED